MKTKHTPTPWKVSTHTNPGTSWTIESESGFICDGWGPGSSLDDANAQFITLACNHFEELVEALEFCEVVLSQIECSGEKPLATGQVLDQSRSLLTKLKG